MGSFAEGVRSTSSNGSDSRVELPRLVVAWLGPLSWLLAKKKEDLKTNFRGVDFTQAGLLFPQHMAICPNTKCFVLALHLPRGTSQASTLSAIGTNKMWI